MSIFLDQVTDQLNLRWAWEKVRREATPGDIWFDEVELAGFDLELERNLQSIAAEFRKGRYRLKPLRPLPFPKHADEKGNPRVRQVFQVAIRDQVAWTAVVNVVGPHVDSKMPAWSYGNRLYRSVWIEEDAEGVKRRRIGRYRHASGRLFLPFGQSWPAFRRHVYLATRAMTEVKEPSEMDESTVEELDLQTRLAAEHRCPFVIPQYWQSRRPSSQEPELYWCSIDLEKFYPTLKLRVVRNNIVAYLPAEWRSDAERLLESMLNFRLDTRNWKDDELGMMDIRANSRGFSHIPTGLYVAGFLANAGLLAVDLKVVERLKRWNVAHFRFVDDHIVLAYSMDDLTRWVHEYTDLLRDAETGARINPEKVEPKELAALFVADKRGRKGPKYEAVRKAAETECRLDPQFPSPLMTKTLALVSGIARTDFNLLESDELAALTDQLEHLLLVDLSEEEMPAKTRLSFAATRLTRLVECRLANNEPIIAGACRCEALRAELANKDLSRAERQTLQIELTNLIKELERGKDQLNREVDRAFQLLRKVLRERPDRIRLWTRAILMCRMTGVKGLAHLLKDIQRERQTNALSGEYLRANILCLLGAQSLVAARILRDEGVANWRKQAAQSFLEDVRDTRIGPPNETKDRWFLCMSWQQYCFGIYCAECVLENTATSGGVPARIFFPDARFVAGKQCAKKGSSGHSSALWFWWAGRKTLRDLMPRADGLVKVLGNGLNPSTETTSLWRFFPLDVPVPMLKSMMQEKHRSPDPARLAGWWFDALRGRQWVRVLSRAGGRKGVVRRVQRLLTVERHDTISLYQWCDVLQELRKSGSTDPRGGEWTALEIVRQVGALVSKEPTLDVGYIREAKQSGDRLPCVHPANFRLPKAWLMEHEPSWDEWQHLSRKVGPRNGVIEVSKEERIVDNRYTPLNADSPLFVSVNPVRGLGLLLYGLLRRDFELPAMWNGPGHADVLGMLPKLLLTDMTCSSWTLGLLQGCLLPRVTENLFLLAVGPNNLHIDNDTLQDPQGFSSAVQVVSAVAKCQAVLKGCQLSTLQNRARQLTPVNVRQLTEPDWNKVFDDATSEGDMHE